MIVAFCFMDDTMVDYGDGISFIPSVGDYVSIGTNEYRVCKRSYDPNNDNLSIFLSDPVPIS